MPEPLGKFGSLTWFTADGGERLWPLESPSLMVGRADTNDLVLDDQSVSRRHARLTIENGRLMVEDLGSSTGTFIDGHPIPPHTPSLVDSGQELRLGAILARYAEAPPMEAEESLPDEPMGLVDTGLPPDMPASIRATLIPPATPAIPGGGPVVARLLVNNGGRIVDQLSIVVLDLPVEWVRITTPQVVLVPGESSEVAIAIQVPRSPDATAGTYEFNVVVTSTETQREVFSSASVVVPQFIDTLFEIRPKRSKRNFVLTTENRGNSFITYDLMGRDDEDSLEYEFRPPAVPLQPGEAERVRVRVKGPRRLFGRPEMLSFAIIGRSTTDPAIASESSGQLLVKPPLQRMVFPMFLMIALAAGILAALAYYFWPVWPFDDDDGDVLADDLVSVVHPMCDPDYEEPVSVSVQPRQSDGTTAGRYNQNDVAWADDEYARAKDPDFGPDWCGDTISQCGCAMTSVSNVMTLLGLLTMPQGEALTPRAVNDWLNLDAERKSRGWVSRGYVYGDVVWSAANQLSGQIHERFPNMQTIRFAGFGTGTDEEIRGELRAGRPLVLAVPGHFIAAVGLDADDTILIHDPFYTDRTTLNWYRDRGIPVLKSVKFEPSTDLSGVLITAPQDVRIKVTHKDTGEEVGTLSTQSAEEAAQRARVEVEGSSYSTGDAWRDPTCTEKAPPPGTGINQIWLPGSIDDYIIEYLNTTADAPSVAIHSYDQDGNLEITVKESPPTNQIVTFDPVTPTPTPTPTPTAVTPPPGSGTQTGGGGGATGTATQPGGGTPTPTGSVPPEGGSPTAPGETATTPANGGTPTQVTPTPTAPAPSSVAVACETEYTEGPQLATVTCTGEVSGTFTTSTWSVNGVPAPAAGLVLTSSFTSNTMLTVKLTACNQQSCNEAAKPVIVKFPDPPTSSPATVTPTGSVTVTAEGAQTVQDLNFGCGINHLPDLVTDLDCEATFAGGFTSITWAAPNTTNPNQSSASNFYSTTVPNPFGFSETDQVMSLSQVAADAIVSVRVPITVTVCNFQACTSRTQEIEVRPRIFPTLWWSSPCPAGQCNFYDAVIWPVDFEQSSDTCLIPGETYYLSADLDSSWWQYFNDFPEQLETTQVQFYINNSPYLGPTNGTVQTGEGTWIYWERTWTYNPAVHGDTVQFRARFLGAPNFAAADAQLVTMFGCGG